MPEVLTPAKINLCLLVGPRQPDGYHPVCSLMDRITLFDRLRIEPADKPALSGMELPAEENIVVRALAELEAEAGRSLPVAIAIDKRIPMAAGLAGGSSDAAAVLLELVDLFDLQLPEGRLAEIAVALGADVPFFLTGGMQLAEGIGQVLQPAGEFPTYHLALVTPDIKLSSARVYDAFDRPGCGDDDLEQRAQRLRTALKGERDLGLLASLLVNDLEEPAIEMAPSIRGIKEELLDLGAFGSLMSGSGPSVFGLFTDAEQAAEAAARLDRSYGNAWAVQPYRP